jgi:formylglycine-generating enzyme required for sulfatase activity
MPRLRTITAATRRWLTTLIFSLLLTCSESQANDISITNQINGAYNPTTGTAEVQFDISWANSWRTYGEPKNWDAAWVFCKVRVNGGDWRHLEFTESGHTVPSSPTGISLSLGLADTSSGYNSSSNPAVGVFLYRSAEGFGSLSASGVRLRWNYADNGVLTTDLVEIKIFGIEMVYVPEGAFYVGDGSGSTYVLKQGSADNDPWYISSESADISVTNAVSNGYYYVTDCDACGGTSDEADGATFTIPATFPKGVGSFYIMKGEISQNQWVRFFNTLTSTQKSTRDITSTKGDSLLFRNNVSWISGDATLPDNGGGATYSGVAMNYISWADVLAYLDWSGLRPMSELEFEKAARGHLTPVANEYAWGSTSLTQATSISNGGLANERTQSGSNMAHNSSVDGPVRVGSFASGVNARASSGGGFYGAMELSSNLWERTITIGNTTGRNFQGRYHGDGALTSSGNANSSTWPGPDGSSAVGSGFKGGSFQMATGWSRISNRGYAALPGTSRGAGAGGRGARSSPQVEYGTLLALDAGNVASYPGSGSTWYDLSGNGRNFTLYNGPTFSSGNGGALSFDRVNDYADISYSFARNQSSFSIWFRTSNASNYLFLFNKGALTGLPDVNNGLTVFTPDWQTNSIQVLANDGTKPALYLILNNNIRDGVWHNLVVTFSYNGTNSTLASYLDGTANSSVTRSGDYSTFFNLTSTFTFSYGPGPSYWSGEIANFSIYDRTLSGNEVSNLYNSTKLRFNR